MACIILIVSVTALGLGSNANLHNDTVDPATRILPALGPLTVVVENSTIVSKRDVGLLQVQHFYLWTRHNSQPEDLMPADPKTIAESSFKSRKTFIIIHGYLGWGTEDWIISLKGKLLNLFDCNIISVDWPAGAPFTDYLIINGRVREVAKDLQTLISALIKEKNLNIKDIHAIGHSLGAHIAGFSTKSLENKYGRITGLDPAGYRYRGVNAEDRLDRTDANFVDVIHTNGCYNFWDILLSCFGIDKDIGHVDFWPNGGVNQPACDMGHEGGGVMCYQMMSYKYFIDSLNYGTDDTFYLARSCSDWDAYKVGNCPCGDDTQYMGFFATDRVVGRFFLNTSDMSPYAVRDPACPARDGANHESLLLILISSFAVALMVFISVGTAIWWVVWRKLTPAAVFGAEVPALPPASEERDNEDNLLLGRADDDNFATCDESSTSDDDSSLSDGSCRSDDSYILLP